jgi:hypothetical protein
MKLESWLKGQSKTSLDIGYTIPQDLASFNESATMPGLKGTIAYNFTSVGVSFVTVSFDITGGPADLWAQNSSHLVFFQIEKPKISSRLLQTGSGFYSGFGGQWKVPANEGPAQNLTTWNLWGTTTLDSDVRHFSKWAGSSLTNTTVWQMNDPKLQVYRKANETLSVKNNLHL